MSDTHKNNQDHYRSESDNNKNNPEHNKPDPFEEWVFSQLGGNNEQV
jgi:hypothetical protein